MFKRFWIRGSVTTRKRVAHLAIDLDITAEKLAGYLLADAVERAERDPESIRKLLPRKPPAR